MVPYASAHVLHIFSSVALTQYKVSLNLNYMTLCDYYVVALTRYASKVSLNLNHMIVFPVKRKRWF